MIRTYILPANEHSRRRLDELVEIAEAIAEAMSDAALVKTLGRTRRPTKSLTQVDTFCWLSKAIPDTQIDMQFVETSQHSPVRWTIERADGKKFRIQHPYNRRNSLTRNMCAGSEPKLSATTLAMDLGAPNTFLGDERPPLLVELAEAVLMRLHEAEYDEEFKRPTWAAFCAPSPWSPARVRLTEGIGTTAPLSAPGARRIEDQIGRWAVADLLDDTWHLRSCEADAFTKNVDPVNAVRIVRNMRTHEVEALLRAK